MNRKIFPVKILFALLSMSIIIYASASHALTPVSKRPDGMALYSPQFFRGTVMSAYQQAYAMNFEIWKPDDLPSGWYATFDGYPVAQIAENRWVYGQLGYDGAIRPTNILIGSVIPSNVPGLIRIAAVGGYARYVNDEAFMKIRDHNCKYMGWLNDGYLNTLIAWNTSRVGVWIWLGNRWIFATPNPGEYIWQMLKRLKPWIIEELRKNNVLFPYGEPFEAADLARQWGLLWSGRVILENMKAFRESGGGEHVTSFRETTTSSNNSSPKENNSNNNNKGPQWDVD